MSFTPIRTDRLLLRLPRRSDAPALAERRSDPRVAEYQNCVPPYPLSRAESLLDGLAQSAWLTDGEWSMLTIADANDAAILGDLALHPTWGGRSIEVGYSLSPAVWRKGYALEALGALVDHLWEDPEVTRLSAMLHPDNLASERVLERTGFRFEGRTQLSYWVGNDNTDDLIYGMIRSDHRDWQDRPRFRPHDVHLVGVSADNFGALTKLSTHRSQEHSVPPVTTTLAEAVRPRPDGAPTDMCPFGIVADDELLGFAMLTGLSAAPGADVELSGFLIDRRHQRRGAGTAALDAIIVECRRSGARALTTHWNEGQGSPAPFWERAGFIQTGNTRGAATEAQLVLAAS